MAAVDVLNDTEILRALRGALPAVSGSVPPVVPEELEEMKNIIVKMTARGICESFSVTLTPPSARSSGLLILNFDWKDPELDLYTISTVIAETESTLLQDVGLDTDGTKVTVHFRLRRYAEDADWTPGEYTLPSPLWRNCNTVAETCAAAVSHAFFPRSRERDLDGVITHVNNIEEHQENISVAVELSQTRAGANTAKLVFSGVQQFDYSFAYALREAFQSYSILFGPEGLSVVLSESKTSMEYAPLRMCASTIPASQAKRARGA
jgi:hypothetical protein